MDLTTTQPLKLAFMVHFLLVSWGIQGYWSPDSYLFYNLILLLTLGWAIHCKDNVEPMQLAIGVNLISILFDIVILSVYPVGGAGKEHFSFSMAIINLLARVPSLYLMVQNCKSRLGADEPIPNLFGERRGPYEDIDGRK